MIGQELKKKILIWRIKHIPERNMVLFIAGATGILSGTAAVFLKSSVYYLKNLFVGESIHGVNQFLLSALPTVGILITVGLCIYVFKERVGHGIIKILYSISKRNSLVEQSKIWVTFITSAITVGFGGSVGLEAPVVVTGSAIGSNLGRFVHFDTPSRTLLIGCGAAGAISAIFHAPIGGIIFAVEVLITQMSVSAFIPLLIASVTGSLASKFFGTDAILLNFDFHEDFEISYFPFFMVIAILSALVSVYFARVSHFIESRMLRIKGAFKRALIGGLILGIIIFLFPPIYGEGFDLIKQLLKANNNMLISLSIFDDYADSIWMILLFVLALILLKAVAAAVTIGAGGNGGFFGPSLFIGGMLGYGFSVLVTELGIRELSPQIFILVGMCGVLSGLVHAPLTAIFLIAEITNGYDLFVPLMYVSAISYTFVKLFEEHSIYTKPLIERGELVHHDKDKQVISMIDGKKMIEKDLLTINEQASLGELVDLVKVANRNIFPVLNDEQELLGIITLDDIREIMFDRQLYETTKVNELMHIPPDFVDMKDTMDDVMVKFEKSGAWNLPVTEDGKYVGFLSKSRIFYVYRQKLVKGQKGPL